MAPGFRSFAGLAVASVILAGCAGAGASDDVARSAGEAAAANRVLVAMGDSYMSGEGGRRASNGWTVSESEEAPDRQAGDYGNVTVGDFGVYDQAPQVGPKNDWCHRTASSPGNIGGDWTIINLACSGALTTSDVLTLSDGKTIAWKPGIDYGTNPRTGERAQAKQLEVIAGRSNVERVLLSIGGNNLQFSDLIKWCVEANVKFAGACKNQQRVKDLTNQANQDRVRQSISDALYNIQRAMFTGNPSNRTKDWTLVYQLPPLPLPKGPDAFKGLFNDRSAYGCHFYDDDLNYFAEQVGPTVRNTMVAAVREFYSSGAKKGNWKVRVEDSSGLFSGHRLCEKSTDRVTTAVKPGVQNPPQWDRVGQKSEWVTDISVWEALTTSNLHLLTEPMHPNYWGQRVLASCAKAMFEAPADFNNRVATCSNTSPNDTLDPSTGLPQVSVALTSDPAFVQRPGVDAVSVERVFASDRTGVETLQIRPPGGAVKTYKVVGIKVTQDYPGEQATAVRRKLAGTLELRDEQGRSSSGRFAFLSGQTSPYATGAFGQRTYSDNGFLTVVVNSPTGSAGPEELTDDELIALAEDSAANSDDPNLCAGRGTYLTKGTDLRFAYVDGKNGCEAQIW